MSGTLLDIDNLMFRPAGLSLTMVSARMGSCLQKKTGVQQNTARVEVDLAEDAGGPPPPLR